jgi:lipid-A-disaccharide synthase
MTKIMFSAGEASGDLHASAVAEEIRRLCPEAEMFGMGGAGMARAGVKILYDIKDLGIIGLVEVIRHLPRFWRLRRFLTETMEEEKPDVLVCVDYPGFNMKLAREAKKRDIPVVYYIAPTIWAWHRSRAKDIARDVSMVASIFPFEAEAYKKAGAPVTFVGNPLADTVHPSMTQKEAMDYFGADPAARRILLMPGSRLNEVRGLLPDMLEAGKILSEHFPCQFFLPRAETIDRELLEKMISESGLPVILTSDRTYDLMGICCAAAASSGTATLETALMKLPTVLVYRLASLTWWAAQRLVHVKYAGLPNLLVDREVTPELLQEKATSRGIAEHLSRWLEDEQCRQENIRELEEVRTAMGSGGAVHRTAALILATAEGTGA